MTSASWWQALAASRVARTAVAYAAAAWVLVQVVATVQSPLDWPPTTVRLVIDLAVAGFFVAVAIAAWLDWRARARAQPARPVAPAEPEVPAVRTTPAAATPSVAVLAFADMSPAKDQDYFCEGAAEEIINALSRVPGLHVAARAGSFQFKQRAVDTREIGRLLDVDAVLDGSVRKSGDRLRIAAQLVDTRNGKHLWSETFDRQLEDIFAIQDEIARSTVQALRVTLLSADAARLQRDGLRTNMAAYDQYLRARQLMRKEKEAEQLAAVERLRLALKLDPAFALAHALLASLIAHIVFRHGQLRETLAPEAQQAADRALVLAPESAEAHVALAQVHSMFKRYEDAERAFQRAIELDPRLFDAQYYYARFCASRGDHARAAQHYENAYALQPDDFVPIVLSIQEYQAIGNAAGEHRSIERAWAGIERRLAIDPDDTVAYDHGVGVLALLGRNDESRQFAARAIAMRPHDPTTYYTGACGAVLRGDYDEALDLLERAVELGFRNADWFATDPDMGPLRAHPRYQRLLERLT